MGDQEQPTTNLWESILQDARGEAAVAEDKANKTLVVLGDEMCGKTSLIARLKQVDFDVLPNCLALDYTYMDSIVEEDDEYVSLGKVNVWQLSGNPHFGNLLNVALKAADSLDSVAFLVCVALDKPWTIKAALDRWLNIIARVVERYEAAAADSDSPAAAAAAASAAAARREALEDRWRRYTEPAAVPDSSSDAVDADSTAADPAADTAAASSDLADDSVPVDVLMPLSEGVLSVNLGVPVIIAVCKADMASDLQSQYAYKDAHFDYIQQTLRSAALAHGASLFYTSASQGTNVDAILEYLQSVFYNRPFTALPEAVEKETVLIPAGWDSLSKIEILSESSRVLTRNKTDADGNDPPYEAVIKEPFSVLAPSAADAPSDAVEAEDDQAFLQRFREFIDSDPTGDADSSQITKGLSDLLSAGKKKTQASLAVETADSGRRPSIENLLAGAKPSPTAAAGESEEVLSSFFTSLLKQGSSGSSERSDVKKVLQNE